MSLLEHYFDHAATTPVHPQVLEAMLPFLGTACGNANSIHGLGRQARNAVEHARQQVATAIGAEDPSQIVFTSGATEANAWVQRAVPELRVSRLEHSSLRAAASHFLPSDGYRVVIGGVVSVMAVNNETGGIPQMEGDHEAWHTDATQAIGKVPWRVDGCDWASLSAHKFGGPKGVGALYVRSGFLEPMIVGGGQESGMRAGTLNVPGIVGMGAAIEHATQLQPAMHELATDLRSIVLEEIGPAHVNEAPHQSPFILSASFEDVLGETLVIELDRRGFAVSAGAACSSQSEELSPVLAALRVPDALNRGTVRISFGRGNTPETARRLGRELKEIVEKLRVMGRNA